MDSDDGKYGTAEKQRLGEARETREIIGHDTSSRSYAGSSVTLIPGKEMTDLTGFLVGYEKDEDIPLLQACRVGGVN